MAADDEGKDEHFLADIAAYLDVHEPLQALWGVDSTSLFDGRIHNSALQASSAPGVADGSAFVADIATFSSPSSSSSSPDAIGTIRSSSSDHRQQQQRTGKCVRNIARERQKRELLELRLQCAELEQQLCELQQQQNQSQQQRQQTLLLATWKRIAERQLALRTQAEHENWRLRQKTQQHQLIATNLQQSLRQWTAMMREEEPISTSPSAAISRPTHVAMNVSSVVDAGDVEIYRQLLSEVDAEHQRMDTVLRENGLIHWQVAVKTSTMHMKSRLAADPSSSLYIELMEADVIPFEMEMVFKVIWQCWHRRKIPRGSVVYEHTVQAYSENDSTTILSKMRFDMVANGQSVVMDTLCVVRAYIEHGRISYVLRGITKADGHFPDVYIEETDWCLMKPLQGDVATAIFSCAHMETKQFSVGSCGDMAKLQASPLATLCASAYEVDMDEVSNMMLNMLLQDNSSLPASSYSETAAYVRLLP